jgi:hypothetical protein
MEPVKSSRTVILHAHIFKNAGTSVDNILKHNYGKQFVDHRESDKLVEGKQAFLEDYFRQNSKIVAFASHHLPLPLHTIPGLDYCIIMMLRHPIIRVGSVYRFEHTQRVNNPSVKAAKRYDFADYVRWHLDQGYKTFCNYFIRYCTSAVNEPLTDELRLNYALEQSKHFSVLGVVERFAESMTVLQKNLAANGLDFQVIQSRKNVTDQSSEHQGDKLARIEQALGESLYATILEHNKEDLLFYQHSMQQLDIDSP